MMRAEHYREAERILRAISNGDVYTALRDQQIAVAQVHAMLAACPLEAGHPGDYGVEQ